MGILALPISEYGKTTLKSALKAGYPAFPETLGQHIRKRRMDLGLLQKNVAEIVGTSIDCITFWENGRSQPQIHFFPKIISFLGYYPFDHETETFSGKLQWYRYTQGLSRKRMGILLGVDGSTVGSYEHRSTTPQGRCRERLLELVRTSMTSP